MFDFLDLPLQVWLGQLFLGLINGSFYAILSLGIAVIFGMLNIVNFAHGAQYMLGAVLTWMLLTYLGVGYWGALVLAPLIVALFGVLLERLFIARLYGQHHIYGLLLTFGLAQVIQGLLRNEYGISGLPYEVPETLSGGTQLGFMFMPTYRLWVVVASLAICFGTWFAIERTKLGALLRAATENAGLTQAFGINVPRIVTLTYGFGAGLAALAGVLAAPIYSINPYMGHDILVVAFAVVVIGGMGSILGSIVTGFGLGVIEGLARVIYPEASSTVVFVVMLVVLMAKPAGLFGRAA